MLQSLRFVQTTEAVNFPQFGIPHQIDQTRIARHSLRQIDDRLRIVEKNWRNSMSTCQNVQPEAKPCASVFAQSQLLIRQAPTKLVCPGGCLPGSFCPMLHRSIWSPTSARKLENVYLNDWKPKCWGLSKVTHGRKGQSSDLYLVGTEVV